MSVVILEGRKYRIAKLKGVINLHYSSTIALLEDSDVLTRSAEYN